MEREAIALTELIVLFLIFLGQQVKVLKGSCRGSQNMW